MVPDCDKKSDAAGSRSIVDLRQRSLDRDSLEMDDDYSDIPDAHFVPVIRYSLRDHTPFWSSNLKAPDRPSLFT
jgi:hypothetical protein